MEDSDDSDGSDDSADSDKSDPTRKLPKFRCPFCLSISDHHDDALTHEEKCKETEPDQNVNMEEEDINGV